MSNFSPVINVEKVMSHSANQFVFCAENRAFVGAGKLLFFITRCFDT